jgi:hypothetical protein
MLQQCVLIFFSFLCCVFFVYLCSVSGVSNVDSISCTPDTGQRQTNKKHNTEILSTLGTPDTGQRQTNKNTTQRYCQHWIHQTQNKDKQKKHNTEN